MGLFFSFPFLPRAGNARPTHSAWNRTYCDTSLGGILCGAGTVFKHLVMCSALIAVLAMCYAAGPCIICPIMCGICPNMFGLSSTSKFLCVYWYLSGVGKHFFAPSTDMKHAVVLVAIIQPRLIECLRET